MQLAATQVRKAAGDNSVLEALSSVRSGYEATQFCYSVGTFQWRSTIPASA